MSKSKDGLADILLGEAEREECEREQKRHRAEEEERRRREAEEQERLRREEEERQRYLGRLRQEHIKRKIMAQIKEGFKHAEIERRKQIAVEFAKYLLYYTKYHNLETAADQLRDDLRAKGFFVSIEFKIKFMEVSMKDWPEPYRSKCKFTEEENLLFMADPYNAKFLVSLLS